MTHTLAAFLLLPALAAAERPPGERFALQSIEVSVPEPVSSDGRFRMHANARLQARAEAGDRFQLKTALVDCSNGPADVIFANSFE